MVRYWLIGGLIFLLILQSCEKGCSKKVVTQKQAETEKSVDLAITSFPNLNFAGLSEKQSKSLIKLLNDEVCPCGCPETFAQCISDTGCKPGQLLAQWAIEQLKEGAPEYYLFKAITQEINTGFLADPKSISTLNAAHKGNVQAPITVVEFADFECPACKMAALEMKDFFEEHKDLVQIYFMHMPLSIHKHAETAAVAAEAAGKQGKFWAMHDALFTYPGPLTHEAIISLAKNIFNKKQMTTFEQNLRDQKLLEKVKAHQAYGHNELKIRGTPTFLFNGRPYNLSSSKDGYRVRMAMEQARSEMKCKINKNVP